MTLETKNISLDILRYILSFNDQILTRDNKIIGKINKNDPIFKLLLTRRLIEKTTLYYFMSCYYMVWFPSGHQLLFGYLDNDIKIVFRVRGVKYSRDHNPYRLYTYLLK